VFIYHCDVIFAQATNFRGVRSEAMVLAANNADGTIVELVDPPSGAKPGTKITVEGFAGVPEKELSPKLKIFETVKPVHFCLVVHLKPECERTNDCVVALTLSFCEYIGSENECGARGVLQRRRSQNGRRPSLLCEIAVGCASRLIPSLLTEILNIHLET
jgi:hypothetical protein